MLRCLSPWLSPPAPSHSLQQEQLLQQQGLLLLLAKQDRCPTQERKDLHEERRRRAAPPPGYRVVGCAVPMKALLQFAADDRLIPESAFKMADSDFFDVRLSMDGRGFADQFNTIGAFMRP